MISPTYPRAECSRPPTSAGGAEAPTSGRAPPRRVRLALAAALFLAASVVVLGAGSAAAQGTAAERAAARQLLEDGKVAFQKKRFDEAALKFRQAYDLDNSLKTALYNRAFALRKGENLKAARQAYLEYIAVSPDDNDGLFGLAETERLLGNRPEALRLFTEYLSRERRPEKKKYVEYAQSKSEELRAVAEGRASVAAPATTRPGSTPAPAARPSGPATPATPRPAGASGQPPGVAEMEAGTEAYRAGRYREAADQYARAYLNDSALTEALYRRALALRKANDFAGAIQAYKAYLNKDPGSLDGVFGLAETHRLAGNDQEARRLFDDYVRRETRPDRAQYLAYAKKQLQALVAAPAGPSAADKAVAGKLLDDGKTAYGAKKYKDAADLFHRAAELDPGLHEATYREALARRRAGDLAGAKAAYEAFLQERPDDADAHYGLAETHRLAGNTEGARKHFARYVELEKRPSEAEYVERAKQFIAASGGPVKAPAAEGEGAAEIAGPEAAGDEGAAKEAQAIADAAKTGAGEQGAGEQGAESRAEVAGVGEAHRHLGAHADLHSSAFSRQVTVDGLLDHGRVALDAGVPEKAAKHFALAIALDPDRPLAYLMHARALEQLGRADEAHKRYQQVVDMKAEGDTAALAEAGLGRTGHSRVAGRSGPTTAQAAEAAQLVEAAEGERRSGDLEGAIAHLEEAAKLNPRHAATFILVGDVQLARGKALPALQAYQRALALAPERAAPLYGIAQAYEKVGEKRVALHHYRLYARSKALDVDKGLQRQAWMKTEGLVWPLEQD